MARRESTNDTEGFACPLDHHARHRSGFTCLPHWKNLTPIVIGVTSRKVGGNLGDDINLIRDTLHGQFTDHLDTRAVAALPDMQGAGQVRNLREAATLSTGLAQLLTDFAAADRAEQQALLDTILKAWSNTSTMVTTFGGAYSGHSLTVNGLPAGK